MFLLFAVIPTWLWLARYPRNTVLILLCGMIALSMLHGWWMRAWGPQLGMGSAGRRGLLPTLLTGLVLLGFFCLAVGLLRSLMGLPIIAPYYRNPLLWLGFLAGYTVLCFGQEYACRAWFFWRYSHTLPRPVLIWVNGLLFGWAHIIFGTWQPMLLSTLAGLLLAMLYARHRSLLGVTLLHTLAGLAVFLLGMEHAFARFAP